MSRPALSPAEARIYRAIAASIEAGISPSYRELLDRLGLASAGSLQRGVLALVSKGYVRRRPGRDRGLSLAAPPGLYTVALPDDIARRLGERAAAMGETPESVILRAVHAHLGAPA